MHAVVIEHGTVAVRFRPDPSPGPGEVLVAVRAAAISGLDILQVAGRYSSGDGSAAVVPGRELTGVVVEVGSEVDRLKPGDRVMGLVDDGAHAELARVPAMHLAEVPPGVAWPVAGSALLSLVVAHDALVHRLGILAGDHVLVRGAAGGIGTLAVQVARRIGARVVAVSRDARTYDALRSLGAHQVVSGDDEPAEGPFDGIVELVGPASLQADVSLLAPGGRIALIGVSTEPVASFLAIVLMLRQGTVHGFALREHSPGRRQALVEAVSRRWLPSIASSEIRVPIAAELPAMRAAEAFELAASRGRLGRVVLRMDL